MEVRVEPYLDGDLPPDEEAAFERRMAEEAAWRDEVAEARRIRQALRDLPSPACPPRVERAVRRNAKPPAARERPGRRFRWKPAVAAFVLAALVGAALLLRPPAPEQSESQYTQAEIERATQQAKWTLAYIAHIGAKTGETVQQDVFRPHVAQPVDQAFRNTLLHDVSLSNSQVDS